jgi:hypothetical protein
MGWSQGRNSFKPEGWWKRIEFANSAGPFLLQGTLVFEPSEGYLLWHTFIHAFVRHTLGALCRGFRPETTQGWANPLFLGESARRDRKYTSEHLSTEYRVWWQVMMSALMGTKAGWSGEPSEQERAGRGEDWGGWGAGRGGIGRVNTHATASQVVPFQCR